MQIPKQSQMLMLMLIRGPAGQISLRRHTGLPSTPNISTPRGNLIQPTTRNKHTGNGVDNPNEKRHETRPLLTYYQQDWLNVVLEENARNKHWRLGKRPMLTSRRILVRGDMAGAMIFGSERKGLERTLTTTVYCRHDREEVLELIVVGITLGDSLVERIHQAGVVMTKREFVDHVGEVESYKERLVTN